MFNVGKRSSVDPQKGGAISFAVAAARITIAPMIDLLQQHLDPIATLCRKYGVQKLDVFGSAARGDFDPARSDIDFFFEFDSNPSSLSDRFFGLLEDLEQLLGRKVDLVSSKDVRNPFFLKAANQHRIELYAA